MKFPPQVRKVALIIEVCPTVPRIKNFKAVKLVFFSPSNTSKAQTINQGVIRASKAHFIQY